MKKKTTTSISGNATKKNLHSFFTIFRYTSAPADRLKSLVVALAMPTFFALSIKKWLRNKSRFIFSALLGNNFGWQSCLLIFILVMIFVGCNTKSDLVEPKVFSKKAPINEKPVNPSDNLMIWKILDTTTLMANYVLDLEKMHQFETTEKHLDFVDDLIHNWEPPIKAKPQYSKEEAIQTLTSIHKFIKKQNYKLKDYHPTLNMSISYKYFDCDVLSVFYKTLAEQYQFPIECIYSPKHLSILWNDSENEIYWETTSGKEVDRNHYLDKYKLDDENAAEIGILRPLNRKEMAAIVLHNLARAKFAKKEYDKSLRIVYKSLKMFPELPENHLLLGRLFAEKKDYNNAELSYEMYLDEIPQNKEAENELNEIFAELGCPSRHSQLD